MTIRDPETTTEAASATETETRPLLVGERVFLRPVSPADYEMIRAAELSPSNIVTFRHRGTTPSAEQFVQGLAAGVLTQHIVAARDDGRPLGLATSYGADMRNGHVFVAAVNFPTVIAGATWPLEGFALLIDYLFYAFPFRKIYGEVLEPNLRQFQRVLGEVGREEGRLVGHEYIGGTYVDKVYVAIWRDDWATHRDTMAGPSALLAELNEAARRG